MIAPLLALALSIVPPNTTHVAAARKAQASLSRLPAGEPEASLAALHLALQPFGLEATKEPDGSMNRDWSPPDTLERAPTQAQLDSIRSLHSRLKATLASYGADCQAAYDALNAQGLIADTLAYAFSVCPTSNPECKPLLEIKAARDGAKACSERSSEGREALAAAPQLIGDLEKLRRQQDEESSREAEYLRPASGGVAERAITLPEKFRRPNPDLSLKEFLGSTYDTLGLFAAAHPSRFVYLRRDLKKGRPINPDQDEWTLYRTLRKGEAVLFTGDLVLSIDGVHSYLDASELSPTPIAGARAGALKVTELNVLDATGHIVAGPGWMLPDDTGFALSENPPFLSFLEPPEPRTQRFHDARQKVSDCYTAKLEQIDPEGTLRKYFDVVRVNRFTGEVVRLESAEAALDRKACAACNCKAFNALKAKLAREAITPVQAKAFEAYRPVLEKLNAKP